MIRAHRGTCLTRRLRLPLSSFTSKRFVVTLLGQLPTNIANCFSFPSASFTSADSPLLFTHTLFCHCKRPLANPPPTTPSRQSRSRPLRKRRQILLLPPLPFPVSILDCCPSRSSPPPNQPILPAYALAHSIFRTSTTPTLFETSWLLSCLVDSGAAKPSNAS